MLNWEGTPSSAALTVDPDLRIKLLSRPLLLRTTLVTFSLAVIVQMEMVRS